jgi:hypothetical protein
LNSQERGADGVLPRYAVEDDENMDAPFSAAAGGVEKRGRGGEFADAEEGEGWYVAPTASIVHAPSATLPPGFTGLSFDGVQGAPRTVVPLVRSMSSSGRLPPVIPPWQVLRGDYVRVCFCVFSIEERMIASVVLVNCTG